MTRLSPAVSHTHRIDVCRYAADLWQWNAVVVRLITETPRRCVYVVLGHPAGDWTDEEAVEYARPLLAARLAAAEG